MRIVYLILSGITFDIETLPLLLEDFLDSYDKEK